jgi:hypothetical protein
MKIFYILSIIYNLAFIVSFFQICSLDVEKMSKLEKLEVSLLSLIMGWLEMIQLYLIIGK